MGVPDSSWAPPLKATMESPRSGAGNSPRCRTVPVDGCIMEKRCPMKPEPTSRSLLTQDWSQVHPRRPPTLADDTTEAAISGRECPQPQRSPADSSQHTTPSQRDTAKCPTWALQRACTGQPGRPQKQAQPPGPRSCPPGSCWGADGRSRPALQIPRHLLAALHSLGVCACLCD